jgi:hypothetical protein
VASTVPSQPIVRFNGLYFPPKFVNKMKYAEFWTVSTAGGIQAYNYKMNSIYDPYGGAGGNGCYGIDEIAAIYNRYQVTGATMTITATAQAVEGTQLYVYADGDSTSATQEIAESSPTCRFALLGQYWPQTFVISAKPGTFLAGANDRDLTALATADPAVMAYFHILIQNSTAAALNVMIRVQIIFDVIWSGLICTNDLDA